MKKKRFKILEFLKRLVGFPFYLIFTFVGMLFLLVNNIIYYWTGEGLD